MEYVKPKAHEAVAISQRQEKVKSPTVTLAAWLLGDGSRRDLSCPCQLSAFMMGGRQ